MSHPQKQATTLFTVGSLIPALSSYSPISTLERQYKGYGESSGTASGNQGKRYLFLQANADCCVSLEQVLRMARKQPASLSQPSAGATQHAVPFNPESDPEPTVPFPFSPDSACALDTAGSPNLSATSMKKSNRFGKFFQSIKDTSSHAITAGMHQLAVRNDSKDCLVICAMDEQSQILGVTEAKVMAEDGQTISFSIPISVVSTLKTVTLHLCVKSTATLVASKHYWIAQVNVPTNTPHQEVSLHSLIVPNGRLICDFVRDGKNMNWCLSDPILNARFHNLPLDQRYAFVDEGRLLLATERTVESTLVVPVAAALSTIYDAAARLSMKRAQEKFKSIHEYRHSAAPTDRPYADVQVRISHWQTNMASVGLTGRPNVAIFYQRPDSIFETTVLEPTALPLYPSAADGFRTPIAPRFYANAIDKQHVMPTLDRMNENHPAWGAIRLEISLKEVDNETNANNEVIECYISLESHIMPLSHTTNVSLKHNNREYKVFDKQGHCMGNLVLALTVVLQQVQKIPSQTKPLGDGLVELMGLMPVTDGILPNVDLLDKLDTSKSVQRRRQQLKILGVCYTSEYLEQHMNEDRSADLALLADRATQYKTAIQTAMQQTRDEAANNQGDVAVYADRKPKPFRPSSSRATEHLAGLGFNVHVASFSLTHNTSDDPRHPSLATFHNVTCGAPADHARGFGKLYEAPGVNISVAGGLRRLEFARQTLGQHITALQDALCLKALRYLDDECKARKRQVTHISPNIEDLRNLRWKLFEAIQCLHSLTWTCSVRRTSVFSQALGIALTSYLDSISDPNKCASQWPELWSKNGFLVSYEGLLSAAGKELGMIEDAAVGIDMLRNVRVILAPDDGGFAKNPNRVPVPYSEHIKWVHIWTAREREGAPLSFCLQVGIDFSYFTERVPLSLKNGTAVCLLGALFEVGVDIFQAASNAGSNLNKNMSTAACNPMDVHDATVQDYSVKDVLSDDEDTIDADDEDLTDTSGISGTDALVQLNYEAFQKLNAYAHAVSPVGAPSKTAAHPMLATLYQHIASSAGKVNHDILVEASTLAQQLGGGGVVFLTYKQTHVLHSVLQNMSDADLAHSANLIRLYGTRLPICEKNVGQAKYAFNSLQVKFMPQALKPPMNALAGFLKGGKVFGGGGIES